MSGAPIVILSHVEAAAAQIIAGVDVLVKDGGQLGDPALWRVIAAVALQMEARALGIDHSLPLSDKTLTSD